MSQLDRGVLRPGVFSSARCNDVQIEFICVPENMMRLLRVNQVDELFKVAHAI